MKYGEGFFTSMGFAPLPKTFWERSLFIKPADRDVVCHASAWDIDGKDDLRIKTCLQVRGVDFVTVHHELGHNFYQRAYKNQPYLFQSGANDGFHEAIGDAIALAITPEYLHKVGLLDTMPTGDDDIPELLKQAMERVAFLPFGLMIDQWRWKVFSGEIKPADYNKAWWDLRLKYQGVAPPDRGVRQISILRQSITWRGMCRTSDISWRTFMNFSFIARCVQASGYSGPLNRCTFYGSKEAGDKFNQMLEVGQSKPWPVALESDDWGEADRCRCNAGVFCAVAEVAG